MLLPRTRGASLEFGLRYEPLADLSRPWSNMLVEGGQLRIFVGGQAGTPRGLLYPNKLNFAPRFGIAHHFTDSGILWRAAYGMF